MSLPCPCENCTERFIACSDRCPKDARGEYGHKAWKEKLHAQKRHLEEQKNRWERPWSDSRERKTRFFMKKGPGKQKGGYQ